MRRRIAFFLALCMLFACVACAGSKPAQETPSAQAPSAAQTDAPAAAETAEPTEEPTPEPTQEPVLTLKKGKYGTAAGDSLHLYELKDGNRAGILFMQDDVGTMMCGVSWTEDSLIIEKTPVEFTGFNDIIEFTYLDRAMTFVYEAENAAQIGTESGDPLALGDAAYFSVFGDTATFGADGTGTLTAAGKGPVPFLWAYSGSGSDAVPYTVVDSFLGQADYQNGVLTLRTDETETYSLSRGVRKEVEGTVVNSPEFDFRVVLADPDWTYEQKENLYNFKRSDSLAFGALYSIDIEGVPTIENVDVALRYYLEQVNGTPSGEIEDWPVGGLPGRLVRAKMEVQGNSFETAAAMFHNGGKVYYLTITEYGSFSESTEKVLQGIRDSFTTAQ